VNYLYSESARYPQKNITAKCIY